jgi:hypothetical protein
VWAALRRFVGGWHGIALTPPGGRADDARALEDELGRPLPEPVHEWAALHADLPGALFDRAFRDGYDLAWQPEIRAVTLLLQSERDHWWGVAEADLDQAAPPVTEWSADPYRPRWLDPQPGPASIPHFVLEHAAAYLFGTVGRMSASTTPDGARRLASDLDAAGFHRLDLGPTTLFERAGAAVLVRRTRWTDDEGRPEVRVNAHLADDWVGSLPLALAELGRRNGGAFGLFRPGYPSRGGPSGAPG